MQRNRSRRSTAVLIATATALALIAPARAIAQEATPALTVTPEISPPAGRCAVKGGETILFSGETGDGATLTSAWLRRKTESGSLMSSTDVKNDITIAPDGTISGQRTITIDQTNPPATIELELDVARDAETASGASDPDLTVDVVKPAMVGAHTISREEVVVEFSEAVFNANGDSPVDWKINGNMPSSVTGTGDTRTLRVGMNNRWGEDATPTVEYNPPLNRTIYRDCADSQIVLAGRTQTALDETKPAVPVINQIDGKSATDNDVASTDATPAVVVGTVTNGHTVDIYRETGGDPAAFDPAQDTKLGSGTASGGSATIDLPALPGDGDYPLYAVAKDTATPANRSDADAATYRLDTRGPRLTSATADASSVLVVFDDALLGGTADEDDWSISLGSTNYPVTAVSGQGNQRTLSVANVPNGATLDYDGDSGYADEAGNPAAAGTVPVDSDFTDPNTMTLDVQPESQERASGSSQTFSLHLIDYFGVPVQGARLGGKVLAGPNSTRDLDGNVFTGIGVFGTCVTDASGTCTLTYGTQNAGTDQVLGWIDVNNNSSADEVTGNPESSDASGATDVSSHDTVNATTTAVAIEPTPTPTPEPTPTPDPGPSSSPSPSPSPSPTPTSSPTAGPTPDPTPTDPVTPSPDPLQERSVSVTAEKAVVDLGEATRLSGLVVGSEACRAGAEVRIMRGDQNLGSVIAGADGTWTARLSSVRNATYHVQIPAGGPCAGTTSDEITVKVRAAVEALVLDPRVPAGGCARVKGRVTPNKSGAPVWLQQRIGGRWRSIDTADLSSGSRFSFPACFDRAGQKSLRVKWMADGINAAGTSPGMRVRVTK